MSEKVPPFSLKDAEKWLHWLEDVATIERDSGYACRLILGNLLVELHKSQLIDGKAFLERIIGAIDNIPERNYQLSTRIEAENLLKQLTISSIKPYMPSKSIH
jgi:hypothetical protein